MRTPGRGGPTMAYNHLVATPKAPTLENLADVAKCLSDEGRAALLEFAERLLRAQEDFQEWQEISLAGLAEAYGDDEPDYDALLAARE